jgi:hypothetical protein
VGAERLVGGTGGADRGAHELAGQRRRTRPVVVELEVADRGGTAWHELGANPQLRWDGGGPGETRWDRPRMVEGLVPAGQKTLMGHREGPMQPEQTGLGFHEGVVTVAWSAIGWCGGVLGWCGGWLGGACRCRGQLTGWAGGWWAPRRDPGWGRRVLSSPSRRLRRTSSHRIQPAVAGVARSTMPLPHPK